MIVLINGVEYFPKVSIPIDDRKFPDVILATRKAIGYTLNDAAKYIGCSKSYLHGLEKGTGEPSLRMAGKIAYAYGIRIDALFATLE